MKISVIIPVHNREAFIETAIRSLLRQREHAEFDIIVVDDGSTDGTAERVATIAARDACVRLIRQEKTGVARARNAGLEHVPPDAELVTFLDSDDISVDGRFATEIPLFREDADLALTYSRMTLAERVDDERMEVVPDSIQCTLRGISLTTAIFRKRTIDALGFFNEDLAQSEDWDYLVRFFERPAKYLLVDNVSIIYRRHPGNTTRNKAEAHRYFMLVTLQSAQRRRRDPTIPAIPKFFDFTEFFDKRFDSLR